MFFYFCVSADGTYVPRLKSDGTYKSQPHLDPFPCIFADVLISCFKEVAVKTILLNLYHLTKNFSLSRVKKLFIFLNLASF